MKPKNTSRLALVYAFPFVLLITVLTITLLIWEKRNLDEEQLVELREASSALVQQIVLTRIWNAEHGGIYVEVSKRTQPNPYLIDPERDIVSISGKHYTKINPAYMTRQISELSQLHHGYRFSLVSLNPLNPVNQPDPWEREALSAFARGGGEQMTIDPQDDQRFFKFIAPLKLDQPCLRCHAAQHYQIGDIKGGISVTLPMKESDRIHQKRASTYVLFAAGLWTVMTIFVIVVSWALSRKISRETAREVELGQLKAAVELAGAAAHEMRQPLTVLMSYGEIIREKLAADENLATEFDVMTKQCLRLNDAISKMQNLTEYKTKAYVGEDRIVDLGIDPNKYDK